MQINKSLLKKIFIGLGVLIVGFFALSIYSLYSLGYFSEVKATEKEIGPWIFAYKPFVGPYQNVGKPMDEVYQFLKKNKIESQVGIGIYLDNPAKVKPEKLRSEVGEAISEKDKEKLEGLEDGIKTKTIAKKKRIVVEFPFKNQASIMVGVMKAYPALNAYIEQKKYKFADTMEIYDMKNGKILYIVDIKK